MSNSKEAVIKFSGAPGKGLTFEEFDRKALSWARKQYGNAYAKPLWENTLPDISNLDLSDDLDYFVFEEHCEFVYDVLGHESAKHADTLYSSAKFWTKKWQLENRQRQYEKMFCYLETICEGEAERQLHVEGVDKTKGLRKHFFESFGSGQPDALLERVQRYLLLMPDSNGVAFPPRVNMVEKLNQLEEERNYLLRMCPKEKHKEYEEGKEATLVRNILHHLPAEYDDAVSGVRTLMKIREMIKTGDVSSITNLDDAVRINYDTSWIPPYAELRVGLVNAYMKMKKRWDQASTARGKAGHPVMMTLGDEKREKRCYGCGQFGHLRGDASCTAGKDDIWGGAPKAYLDKVQKRFGLTPNGSKRQAPSTSKQICPYWSSGDGYCKYAERCKFEHSGPQGGSKRGREFGSKGKGKRKGKGGGKGKGKSKGRGGGNRTPHRLTLMVQKKGVKFNEDKDTRISSMIVGARNQREDKHEGEESDVENDLYNLMRGHSVMMIAADSDESDNESEEDSDDEIQLSGGNSSMATERKSSEAVPEERSSAPSLTTPSASPQWGSMPTQVPTWGNNPLPDVRNEEWADEWREKGRAQDRRSRDQTMARGGSPPPKLDEEKQVH